MSSSKYVVVIVLAIMALGVLACDQCDLRGNALAGPTGMIAYALITPDPALHDKCIKSCAATFPDKYSVQYRACARGCGK